MVLTKEIRNVSFKAIQVAGLDPADFAEPYDDDESKCSWFVHNPTGSYFGLTEIRDFMGKTTVYKVVGDQPRETVRTANWLREFEGWLSDVDRFAKTPDLWAEFVLEREALNGATPAPADNTPFTADEQAEIETRLRDVATYAAESGKFADEELQTLNAKIDYLIESSKHARRFDWRELVIGAFLSAVVGNLLPQGATMDVLNMVIGTVGHLIGQPVLGLSR